jgi:hypothetical protein
MPGFVKTGNFLLLCREREDEAGAEYWDEFAQNMACKGAAAWARALLAHSTACCRLHVHDDQAT